MSDKKNLTWLSDRVVVKEQKPTNSNEEAITLGFRKRQLTRELDRLMAGGPQSAGSTDNSFECKIILRELDDIEQQIKKLESEQPIDEKLAPARKRKRRNEYEINLACEIAGKLWGAEKANGERISTREEMADKVRAQAHPELGNFSPVTIAKWIKELHPFRSPGQPGAKKGMTRKSRIN